MGCFRNGSSGEDCRYRVELLDESSITVEVKARALGEELVERVLSHLNLVEKDYFGLRYLDDHRNTHWLDPLEKVKTQLKKRRAAAVLYFGVKFYAADPCKLHEEITRYHYFLQLRRDVAQGRVPLPFEASVELCALIVQADAGDYDEQQHGPGYVSEFRLTPNQSEELEEAVAEAHRKLKGMKPENAELAFLQKIKDQEMYGVDLHRAKVRDVGEFFIGLTPSGVVIHRNDTRMASFNWPEITNVFFKGKEFSLHVSLCPGKEDVRTFELPSAEACLHLWKCCVEHHSFFRLSRVKDKRGNRTSFFSFGSKYRYSGRTECQALAEAPRRQPPRVPRRPSRRQESRHRRNPRHDEQRADLNSNVTEYRQRPAQLPSSELAKGVVARIAAAGVYASAGVANGMDSPRSVKSAPWAEQPTGGLFTSGRDSPKSVRSEKTRSTGRPTYFRSDIDGSNIQALTTRSEVGTSEHITVNAHGFYSRHRQRRNSGESDFSSVSTPHTRYQHKDATAEDNSRAAGRTRPQRPTRGELSQMNYSSVNAAAILGADAYYVNIDQCEVVSRDRSRSPKRSRTAQHRRASRHKKVTRQPREPPPRCIRPAPGSGIITSLGSGTAAGTRIYAGTQAGHDQSGHPALAERRSNASAVYHRKPPQPSASDDINGSSHITQDKRQRPPADQAANLSAVLMMSHAPLVRMQSGTGSVHAVVPLPYSASAETNRGLLGASQSFKVGRSREINCHASGSQSRAAHLSSDCRRHLCRILKIQPRGGNETV